MCVGEVNYKQQAEALVSGGFRAAGYKTISIDDCWEQRTPERDSQGRLAPDPKRFPSGFKALAGANIYVFQCRQQLYVTYIIR